MPPPSSSKPSSQPKGAIDWRPTKIMNMRDLSKDDDFLSHLLVEKLGTGAIPLFVHKMDPSRRLPKTNADDLLQIVRRNMVTKNLVPIATRNAVQDLLNLPPVRYYLKSYTQKQINAFATHASRYFELYHPSGSIEIAHTSRYAHRTGKSELCILATRPLAPGTVISELKGSMANLTQEEDKELKRTDLRNSDIRRDFSVIHSKQMKKNHLFLGPARFVNHDCNNNCELFREGKYITFRVVRPITVGDEITAHYGDGYFGRKNRHCLCETCETNGRGGYAPDRGDMSGTESEAYSDDEGATAERNGKTTNVNLNERRTRRGVYAIVQEQEDDSDESDEEETTLPLAGVKDVPADGEIELEGEATPDLISLPSNRSSTRSSAKSILGSDRHPPSSISTSSSSSMGDRSTTSQRGSVTPFKSIIATRRQRAQETAQEVSSDSNSDKWPETPSCAEVVPHKMPTRSSASSTSLTRSQRESRPSTPAGTPSKNKDALVKKEESEPRVLRARPGALPSSTEVQKPSTKPEVPKGPDGKPLPTCGTCSNILPVISVDSQVVWGLGVEFLQRRGKKRKSQDCPRCLRHFAIYAQPWPSRNPGNASMFLPTPRESTPVEAQTKKVTEKSLSTLDKKLAAAASNLHRSWNSKSIRDERPTKRQKTEAIPMELLVKDLPTPNPKPSEEPPPKRKRGRPRLSSPRRQMLKSDAPGDFLIKRKSIAVQNQPRDSNGRFGKKGLSNGRFARKKFARIAANAALTRAQRAIERGKVKSWLERRVEAGDQLSICKRARYDVVDHTKSELMKQPFPTSTSTAPFNGIGLFRSPNPLSFARRRTWATQPDSPAHDLATTSGEETDLPRTPEDTFPLQVTTGLPISSEPAVKKRLHFEIEGDQCSIAPVSPYSVGALTLKPSPFNFARRRWASLSVSAEKPPTSFADNGILCDTDQLHASNTTSTKPGNLSNLTTGKFSVNPWSVDYDSSSGEEDVILPGSPEPSMFLLQRRATFGTAMVIPVPDAATEVDTESIELPAATPGDITSSGSLIDAADPNKSSSGYTSDSNEPPKAFFARLSSLSQGLDIESDGSSIYSDLDGFSPGR